MERLTPYRYVILASIVALLGIASGCTTDEDVIIEQPQDTPSDESEMVEVAIAEDEIVLVGYLFGAENDVAVILSHMQPNDQRAWFAFAEELANNGYAALTYDFRGHGESEGKEDSNTLDEDLSAVLRYLRDVRGKETIFLVGASMGATTSLVVAAREDVSGVVAVSPPAQFQEQNALEAVPNIAAPMLFIVSEDDAPSLSFDELVDAAGGAGDVERYEGDAHGTELFQSEHEAAFRARLLRFLGEHGGS